MLTAANKNCNLSLYVLFLVLKQHSLRKQNHFDPISEITPNGVHFESCLYEKELLHVTTFAIKSECSKSARVKAVGISYISGYL